MTTEVNLPARLRRALDGLVKSGILSDDDVGILIKQAQARAGSSESIEGPDSISSPAASLWIDVLWDKVTVIRAQAEARRAKTDRSRRFRRNRNR